MLALRWGDIQSGTSEDDPNRYIWVRRNYVNGRFTTPKSKKTRHVDLSRQLDIGSERFLAVRPVAR